MKTNVLVKIAVVAMAAFGAYAFSGNTNQQQMWKYRLDETNPLSTCYNIVASCTDSGDHICKAITPDGEKVLFDTTCQRLVFNVDPFEFN